ncbi:response regulator [Dyadobacter luticola]|uniref:Response regulator n=1 Tax=Dyadobacter luticola TaxID=1979387 RepID=A0A5R9L4L5_9BACT|nr:response regulator [Dyadobacter luticola]TLV03512.1 response regulator [Dyadobacter luticola]
MDQTGSSRKDKVVLIVDDNEDAVTILGRLLEIKGFSANACHSGQAAFELADRLHPAAAVLDLAMPGMDGYTLCGKLREQEWGQSMLIIALSGYSGAIEVEKSKRAGFDEHLTKPLDLGTLIAMLDKKIIT